MHTYIPNAVDTLQGKHKNVDGIYNGWWNWGDLYFFFIVKINCVI